MRRQGQGQRPARGSVRLTGGAPVDAGQDADAGAGDPDAARSDTVTRDETAQDEEARDETARDETARDEGARDETARDGAAPAGAGGMRLRWALLTGLAGGLALTAAFPPYGVWPLAAAGPALLAVSLRRQGLRGSFAVGAVFGLVFFFPLLSWLVNVAWYVWTALAVSESLIFAVLAVGQRLLLRPRAWPVAVAGWWVAIEALRDRWPWGGFPWGRLAMSQADAPTVRWVSVGGPALLSFLIALAGATLAWLIVERRLTQAVCFGGAAGLVLAGAALPVTTSSPVNATVAAIQGDVPHARNLPQLLNDSTVTQNQATATQNLAAQVRAGRRPAPDLVIWPENATNLDPFDYPFIYQVLARAVAAIGRPVLIGEVLNDPRRNVGQLWLPGRGPAAMYVKRQLVPFGEYIPLRGLLSHITSLPSLQPINFTPGRDAVVFRVGKIRLGDVICYEIGFDPLLRSEVAAGANLLSMQTNDADFELDGQTGETAQQLDMARIRAIEFDRSVVVSSITGTSAIIAPDGHMIAHSGLWRQAVLEARVPLLTGQTLAERLGGWPEYVITGLTLLALIAAAAGALGERRSGTAAGAV